MDWLGSIGVAAAGALIGAIAMWLVTAYRQRAALAVAAASLADECARRIAAEASLRQHQAAAADRNAPLASWEWDVASGDVTWSPAMYSLFGLDPESAPPSRARLMAMIHAQDRGRAAAWLATLARSETPAPIELRALRADGASRRLRCECLGIADESGRPRKLLITVRDVTDAASSAFANGAARDEQVALAALIGASVCLVESEADAAGVVLITSVEPGIGTYTGSDRALTEIVVRLLGNAIARSASGSRVTLRAARVGGDFELEIADAGPALGEDEIGERSILGQAKALAEDEGGTLRMTGVPGRGLAVAVRLPATKIAQKVA